MRPRTELALGGLVLLAVAIGIVITAVRSGDSTGDTRRSSYLANPHGARAFAEALEALDVDVTRWRRSYLDLPEGDGAVPLLAVLDPAIPPTLAEVRTLQDWVRTTGDLLLAGAGAAQAMRCYGWEPEPLPGDGVRGLGQVQGLRVELPEVRARLTRVSGASPVDSARIADLADAGCLSREAHPPTTTLLASPTGSPLVLRVEPDSLTSVFLVADGTLFSNRALRETQAGELVLSLVVPRYDKVLIDERHQGHAEGGNLMGAVIAWSWRSPAGWLGWQLIVVGLLALGTRAVRSGPVREPEGRRRRSALAHVQALATALAAARGHGTAIGLLVRGLRRRLGLPGRPASGDDLAWLETLARRTRTPAGRNAVRQLQSLIRSPGGPAGVLQAAHAVEDTWQDLKP
jgi:hypothetical protein